MAIQLTDEQRDAVRVKGNALVSAAAGSGKTAVLVERVISMLTDSTAPIPANRLLIVTFTNAAAAEMRSRIEKRLYEECRKHPENHELLKQQRLFASASIGTIDSFCIDLIRENFEHEQVDVNPDFRILDESGIEPLYHTVLSEIVNDYFEENDPVFRDLLDITGSEYDEKPLMDSILNIFKKSRNMPFPERYFDRLLKPYSVPFDAEHPWYRYAIGRVLDFCAEAQPYIDAAMELASSTGKAELYSVFLDYLSQETAALPDAVSAGWDAVFNRLHAIDFSGKPSGRSAQKDAAKLSVVSAIVNLLKGEIEALQNLFLTNEAGVVANIDRLCAPARLLMQMVTEYDRRLLERQKRENVLTFHNTEHFALRLLCEERDGEIVVREDAAELLQRYDEVLVDEYQDVNDLQDNLFCALSDRQRKLFAVGDVKQSIYGFRGANPQNFLRKREVALPIEQAGKDEAKCVVLSANFRSRPQICDFINFFFARMMTENTGNLVYDESEYLRPGAQFPKFAEPCVELHAIEKVKIEGETPERADKLVTEGRYIADYIHRLMRSGACIRQDKDTLRPARYSDFAILMRSFKGKAPQIVAELRKQGIPVNFGDENLLESEEITTLLALLQVLDNPKSDIQLLTVMLSPIFGFTADQVALLRANCRRGDLITAVTAAVRRGDAQCTAFLERLNEMRKEAAVMPLPRLVSHLLITTDYLNIVSALPDGARRRGNLQLLTGHASRYCETANGGIGGFLRYLKGAAGLASAKTGGGEDAVRIMSMHKSKGLQFPVCILAETNSEFSSSDSKDALLFSEDMGLGFRYYEESLGEKVDSVGHAVRADAVRRTAREEELRLLYVAMTRAEDRLVFISYNSDLKGKLKELSAQLLASGGEICRAAFASTGSMRDWLLMAALLHPDGEQLRRLGETALTPLETDSRLAVHIAADSDITAVEALQPDAKPVEGDAEVAEQIRRNISYAYPYDALRGVEAKASVSQLANRAESERFAFSEKPAFMLRDGLTAAGRGTATHKVMQFIHMEQKPDIEAELARLVEWQFITENEAAAVDRDALDNFFESDIYARIRRADDVRREMRFLTELPATAVDPSLDGQIGNESVVVQGAVDLCFAEPDGVVVLDFKTDRVDSAEELTKAYSEQLSIYAKACEKIFGLPVKERIIYSFALRQEITL